MNNCLGKVLEQRVEDVPRMRVFFLQIAATSHHMGNHMPFKQWNIAFEVEHQNWPRIGEGEVGEGEVVLRVETGQLRRSGVHLVDGLEEVGEGSIDVSRKGFIVGKASCMSSSSSGIGVGSKVAATCRRMSARVFWRSVAREVAGGV